jgi:hypothetical protein
VPPENVTEPFPNVVDASLSVNVITAVWPARSVGVFEVIAMVGAVVSTVTFTWLGAADWTLPAASVWVAATATTPSPN